MKPSDETAPPLYVQVKAYILERIAAGAIDKRGRLPSEHDIVAALGVSRMTVHRAFRELTAAGVLVRVPGLGTFVAPPKPQSSLVEVRNIADEIRARGHAHRAEVLALEAVKATPTLTASFEFAEPRLVFRSLIVHYEDELPVQLEERFVNPAIAPEYDRQDFTGQTTYEYLQRLTPVTEVEHVIVAVAADAVLSERLAIAVGEPCVRLHRRTWSGPTVVTVNAFTYAGTRSTLGSRYRPQAKA